MSYRGFGEVQSSCPSGYTGIWPACVPQIENKPCPACTYGIPPFCCPYGKANVAGLCVDDPTGFSKPPPEFEYCVKGGAAPGGQPSGQVPQWQITPCAEDEIGFAPFCFKKSSIPSPPPGILCPEGYQWHLGSCLPQGGTIPAGPSPVPQKGLSNVAKASLAIGGVALLAVSIGAIAYGSRRQQGK